MEKIADKQYLPSSHWTDDAKLQLGEEHDILPTL